MPQPIDWEAIERTPEFQELVQKRRSFVIPATIFFLVFYMAFILLAAYAEGFMGERVYQGLTVGYVLALTQFAMVLILGLMYLKRSENIYDPLAAKAIERYEHDEHQGPLDEAVIDDGDDGVAAPSGSRAATTGGADR
jgi:uncharacterized membrane protein (DUF485 family)